MLDVLLLWGMTWWLAEEPRVPPPPPLPVLLAPEVTKLPPLTAGEKTAFEGFIHWYAARWPSRVGMLFSGEPTANETRGSQNVDPEVMRELTAWAARTKRSDRLQVQFTRMVYDDVFAVEKRASGTVRIDRGRVTIEMVPPNVERGATNAVKRTSRGIAFRVVPDESIQMTFDGETVTSREGSRPLESATLPPVWRVESPFTFAPIPYLRLLEPFQEFDANARSQGFVIEFGSKNKPGEQVHLVLRARSRAWAKEFSRAEVLLRAETYEPIAIRWFDPADTKETVYVYNDVRRE